MKPDNALLEQKYTLTKMRGTNRQEYDIYLHCANDGKGGDITRGGAPLLTYDEWLGS